MAPIELSDEKQSCHLSLVSLVRYPISELKFLVCNLRSHALGAFNTATLFSGGGTLTCKKTYPISVNLGFSKVTGEST